jgi:arylsulfatase A-like enzyme
MLSRLFLASLVTTIASSAAAAAPAGRPNFLVILVDDVGWGEFGFQGGKDIPTPHIDSIAKNGVRFPQGYVSGPYCSPTRAGLMTGRYQTRFGHEFNSTARVSGLALSEKTIAQRLKQQGYATCAIGKWHLGGGPEYRPMKRGFDEFYGTLANTPFFHPTMFVDSRVSSEVQPVSDPAFYTTDAYAQRAVDWLEKHQGEPWFLYLPFNAQHAPLQAPEKYLARAAQIGDEKRRTFAAMMIGLDDAIGRVLARIRELGQEENTLIFFVSDNGGPTPQTTSSNGPLHGFKATTWEGGVRVPFCAQWKGKLPGGAVYEHPVIQLDILPTCLAAAGAPASPEDKLDGVNLMPYLTGENKSKPHETFYWRFGAQRAIRHGDWKLVVGRGGGPTPELYNLADDLSETRNLAGANPEKAQELEKLWSAWNAEQAPPNAPDEPARKAKQGKGKGKGKGKAKKKAVAAAD